MCLLTLKRRLVTKRRESQDKRYAREHRFLECSGTQGSNSSGAGGGGGREHITPELRVEPWFELLEPRFNLEFEIWYSNSGSGNSMFELWVLELHVRTLGSETPCSNPGFGELCWNPGFWFSFPFREFEPWVRKLYDSNPGFGGLYVGTPGSGTPSPPREFEPWVRELHMFRQISIVTTVAEQACSMIVRRSGA